MEKRCRGCARFRNQVKVWVDYQNMCRACWEYFQVHGHFRRSRSRRDTSMSLDQLRKWFLEQCERQGTHLLYQGERRTIGVRYRAMTPARLHWFLEYGEDPEEWVLHTPECEKELGKKHWRCVALNHLKLGTCQDNGRDLSLTGNRSGEQNGQAKLTRRDVREIRRLYETGRYSQEDLAKKFSRARSGISDRELYTRLDST